MKLEIINQMRTFIVFIIDGLLIGIVFDFFRILRRSFKTNDFITYIEDICFWIITGIILLYSIFIFNNGILRIYIFVAVLAGISIYILLFSKFVIKICVNIITLIKNILYKLKNIICYPFLLIYRTSKRIFIKPISFIFINFKKFKSKKNKLCLKTLKNRLLFIKKEGKQVKM